MCIAIAEVYILCTSDLREGMIWHVVTHNEDEAILHTYYGFPSLTHGHINWPRINKIKVSEKKLCKDKTCNIYMLMSTIITKNAIKSLFLKCISRFFPSHFVHEKIWFCYTIQYLEVQDCVSPRRN